MTCYMPTAVTISILQMLRLKCAKRGRGLQAMHLELNWGQRVTETFKAWDLPPIQCLLDDPQKYQVKRDSVIKPAAHSTQLCHPPAAVLNDQEAASFAVPGVRSPFPASVTSLWLFPAVAQQCFCSPNDRSVVSLLGSTQASLSPPLWCSADILPGDLRLFFKPWWSSKLQSLQTDLKLILFMQLHELLIPKLL